MDPLTIDHVCRPVETPQQCPFRGVTLHPQETQPGVAALRMSTQAWPRPTLRLRALGSSYTGTGRWASLRSNLHSPLEGLVERQEKLLASEHRLCLLTLCNC